MECSEEREGGSDGSCCPPDALGVEAVELMRLTLACVESPSLVAVGVAGWEDQERMRLVLILIDFISACWVVARAPPLALAGSKDTHTTGASARRFDCQVISSSCPESFILSIPVQPPVGAGPRPPAVA